MAAYRAMIARNSQVTIEQNGAYLTMRRSQSVTEQTASMLRQYGRTPAPTLQELKDAAAQAIAEVAMRDSGR